MENMQPLSDKNNIFYLVLFLDKYALKMFCIWIILKIHLSFNWFLSPNGFLSVTAVLESYKTFSNRCCFHVAAKQIHLLKGQNYTLVSLWKWILKVPLCVIKKSKMSSSNNYNNSHFFKYIISNANTLDTFILQIDKSQLNNSNVLVYCLILRSCRRKFTR